MPSGFGSGVWLRGLAHFLAEKMLFFEILYFRRKLCLPPSKQTGALILRERLRLI